MKYLNLGLVALSSLFASAYAAPANAVDGLVSDSNNLPALKNAPATPDVPVLSEFPGVSDATDKVNKRAQIVHTKVQYTYIEVRKHCGAINETVDNTPPGQVQQKKADIIKLVKSEVAIIVSLINTLITDVVELLGESTEIVGDEKDQIISSVLQLVFEILCTLQKVIKVLGITIFELLGPLVFVLLSVVCHLLTTLNTIVAGLLQCVLSTLGGVIGLLLEVLSGLLPTVLGLAGGILDKLNLDGLLCNLL
ncbi:hypothetical protein CGRA01v4_12453 [Colletotrichum graminicola]|uniref:Uncharacterized protein n=1 Tax=Colletotrichum graminicola (strain M1.001 / M2 / FGSC 10212) TaxID=645133 RepID=E3QSX9_COLGM|nr:uncharacterized protein GLRG_09111 [Colletotrichum graminicola M1.001]EFQ33967.1 hypothetical protein GLRG_09111 [Colletotrichum graminicola M1.001]WDK21165.1 hypothetical protein CGRA01v4_12453 [Colletotrichum graminicola]